MYKIEDISYIGYAEKSELPKPPLDELSVGQSVLVCTEQMPNSHARAYASRKSISGKRFRTKAVDGGTRIFRVK